MSIQLSKIIKHAKILGPFIPEYISQHGIVTKVAEERLNFEILYPPLKQNELIKFFNDNKIHYVYYCVDNEYSIDLLYSKFSLTIIKNHSVIENRIWEIITNGVVPV